MSDQQSEIEQRVITALSEVPPDLLQSLIEEIQSRMSEQGAVTNPKAEG